MSRLITLADSLYWLAASLVVIGGFFVFIGSVIKHLWTSAVERKAATMKNTYHYQTNIDIYNIFFGAQPRAPRPPSLTTSKSEKQLELEGPVDFERVAKLLRSLLHRPADSGNPTPSTLRSAWTYGELSAARDLCIRASDADLSPGMQERCAKADELLTAALAIEEEDHAG